MSEKEALRMVEEKRLLTPQFRIFLPLLQISLVCSPSDSLCSEYGSSSPLDCLSKDGEYRLNAFFTVAYSVLLQFNNFIGNCSCCVSKIRPWAEQSEKKLDIKINWDTS
jgi:hypothetical protein